MSDNTQYQGSQAYAQNLPSEESVTTNSGTVNFAKTLINLRGKTKAIDLSVQLSYTSGAQGSFGLPGSWGFGIPFTIPGKSLTSQGKTFVVDPDWSDQTGYQSGLRYINHHGMKFERIIPAQPLPSGNPGSYGWRFRLADGAIEYFDELGKLLEHDDIDGNWIYYAYVDQMQGPRNTTVDHILDSWGQTIQFQLNVGVSLTVSAPDGGQTIVTFGSQGIDSIKDAMGYTTSFTYHTVANIVLFDTINFPTGLQSKFEYTQLSALDQAGNQYYIPACSKHAHLDNNGNIVSNTNYAYGQQTNSANYTGSLIHCRMGVSQDSLMESNSQDYRYDVAVVRLDANENIVQMSRVYYNYLHLSMQEDHYVDPTSSNPAYRTVNSYNIPVDWHARSTSYSQPIQVEQFHYSPSVSKYTPLRRATSTYDEFGCPMTTSETMWDAPTNSYITQTNVTSTYTATSWGGEMLQSEIYADLLTGREKQITYELDANQRHIAGSSVTYREDGTSDWKAWKTKSYTYDSSGRVAVETVSWSTGADIPQGSVQKYTYTKAYNFDSTTGILTTSTTDPLGNTGSLSYQMKTTGGPLVTKTSPLGMIETFKYDLLGRVTEVTDGLGFTTKTSYSVGPSGMSVQTQNTLGYITKRTHDVLGRIVQIADSGNQGSAQADRVLSQTEYDVVSNAVKHTNELGLVSTRSYDALSRVTQCVDIYGNMTTIEHDDDKLTTVHKLNGDLRTMAFADGMGRPIKVVSYADSASGSTYELALETVYNGFGKVATTKHLQQPVDGSAATILSQKDTVYDVEGMPYLTTSSGLSSTLTGNMDQVVRKVTSDIFGNSVTYSKTVNYGDGRKYTLNGPVSLFDACSRLVQLTNQLGQVETNEFDADGRLITMTRYDGTKFNSTYDKIGQLLSYGGTDGTTSYEYLSNGRLAKVTSGTAAITHTYTPDGCIKSTVFPDGCSQTYVLDSFSRVTQEVDAAGRTTDNTFDSFGRIGTKKLGNSKIDYHYDTVNHTNGIHVGSSITGPQSYNSEIAYDGFGRRNQVTDRNQAGSIILQSVYLLDSRGYLTSREVSSQTNKDPTVNYKRASMYDGFGQLTSDSTNYQQSDLAAQTHEFKYDGNWNVIQKTTNGSSSQFTYNSIDQRQDAGFVYDTNGRLTSDPEGRQYRYDSQDRLMSVTNKATTTYKYHPNSSLANSATANANTAYYYDCGAVNSTLDTTGGTQSWTSYLLQPGRRVAAEKDGTDTTFFLDSQNSVVMSVGAAGSITYDYQAYGSPTSNATRFGWQQELSDPDNGLIYLRSRYYQADHMTFITMDGSRSQENRYAYCYGDPINLVDGSGHDAKAIGGTIAGIVVGLLVGAISGGVLSVVGADICAVSLTGIGVGAAAVSGAAGSIAGDAVNAAIQGQRFTATRAGEDLLIGAVGGAVGAGSGGLASQTAMRMALKQALSRDAIIRIGYATSAVIGGGAGALSSSGTYALLHHEPLFSLNTALSVVIGFGGGLLGAMTGSGLPAGSDYIPVELTDAELHLPTSIAIPEASGFNDKNIFFSSNRKEYRKDWPRIFAPGRDSRDVLRTTPGDNNSEHFTIVAHGEAGRMYASVKYQEQEFYRPISASRFAEVVRHEPGFAEASGSLGGDTGRGIKLISCYGAWSSGQKIANALNLPVWATYWPVKVTDVPNWYKFTPRN